MTLTLTYTAPCIRKTTTAPSSRTHTNVSHICSRKPKILNSAKGPSSPHIACHPRNSRHHLPCANAGRWTHAMRDNNAPVCGMYFSSMTTATCCVALSLFPSLTLSHPHVPCAPAGVWTHVARTGTGCGLRLGSHGSSTPTRRQHPRPALHADRQLYTGPCDASPRTDCVC
jgi:hypothetical protein